MNLLKKEKGQALGEMALLLPIIFMLIFFSLYFLDAMEYRLGAQEAARYAAWENTVYKSKQQIEQEVKDRFKDLKAFTTDSPQGGKIRFNILEIQQVKVDPDRDVHIQDARSNNSNNLGFLQSLSWALGQVGEFAYQSAAYFGFNIKGKARSEISFKLKNDIIPDVVDMPTWRASDNDLSKFREIVFNERYDLVYQTWKAWDFSNPSTPPSNTYQVVESQVRNRVRHIAFLGIANNSVISTISSIINLLGMASPLEVDGAVQIKKVTQINKNRYTVPYKFNYSSYLNNGTCVEDKGAGRYWTEDGGCSSGFLWWYSSGAHPIDASMRDDNDYVKSYECRGPYFEGSVSATERKYNSPCQ